MIHEKIELHVPGSADYAAMYTYFLDLSKEVPIEKRPTVIVCPGGAYAFTSDREAEPIAMRFNAIGMNAVVVRYSVAPASFPTALLEVATAVKYVREEGVKYGCDPEKVFTIGFSAGGHLAASYGNFWSRPFVAEAMNCPSELLRRTARSSHIRSSRPARSPTTIPSRTFSVSSTSSKKRISRSKTSSRKIPRPRSSGTPSRMTASRSKTP